MPRQTILQGLRKEKGLTQMEMAKKLGISETSYRLRELGEADFKFSEMIAITKIFNKEIPDIFLT